MWTIGNHQIWCLTRWMGGKHAGLSFLCGPAWSSLFQCQLMSWSIERAHCQALLHCIILCYMDADSSVDETAFGWAFPLFFRCKTFLASNETNKVVSIKEAVKNLYSDQRVVQIARDQSNKGVIQSIQQTSHSWNTIFWQLRLEQSLTLTMSGMCERSAFDTFYHMDNGLVTFYTNLSGL